MRKVLLTLAMTLAVGTTAMAQRFTDKLDRGLVAVPTGSTSGSSTNLVTWRRLADEYYGVTYNLYKNGSLKASGLTTTCYNDESSAPTTTTYQVAAVVNGVEQEKCDAMTPWMQEVYKLGNTRTPTGYLDINLAAVYDRDGNDVTDHYQPNDAEMADLDGDGQLEIIIKRLNTVDAAGIYLESSREFVVLDAYDVDWQTGDATLMWRIDCGPNMASMNSTEINIIAYDWDEDGSAEVVLRGADNMIVYGTDGKTPLYTIGNTTVNTRNKMTSHTNTQYAWTHNGAEYLIYMNGKTGALYQQTAYPLPRLDSGESSENEAWGDSYGHRSTKHFLGAPFLDGRKASLFLGRGIYTRHKMIAMDLDRDNHTWSETWRWHCYDSSSPWYGNGYHNFIIADVDEDGRDEIVYGSMVIDDNGHGLSTTGYQHGDAQHVSDFNPYRKGLEYFGCLEDSPYWGSNYRDATTSEVLYKCTRETIKDSSGKVTNDNDDGRCLMANFSNKYPGCVGRSIGSGMVNSVVNSEIPDYAGDNYIAWGDLNFRIYWDGDLCSEILNSPGTAREAKVEKPGTGRLFTSDGCNMNNDSKNNPCFQGDIIGDWREEIVVRCGQNLRVYTTGLSTNYSMPCLWYDHQYRQAMVWQMMAYNQPPHLSYFLGELEGITVAPPPLTMEGRTEIGDGGSIGSDDNGTQVILCETNDMTVSVADGASPDVVFVNAPSLVEGTDEDGTSATKVKSDGDIGATNLPDIYYSYYTHTLTDGAFSGATRLTKQGDGILELPNVTETYTGNTDVWAGTLRFNGTMQSSPVWLNRFTTLESSGGTFNGGITADYAARIIPGGESSVGTMTVSTLTLNFGSRLMLDIDNSSLKADKINIGTLTVNTKLGDDVWENYGPELLQPVLELTTTNGGAIAEGTYDLGTINNGSIENLLVEVPDGTPSYTLDIDNKHLKLVVGSGISTTCAETDITESGSWQANDEGILMPVVDVTANTFTYGNEEVTPTLSATFTDQDNNTEDVSLYRTLYKEDYEDATDASDWTTANAVPTLVTDDVTYGSYSQINQGGGGGNRSAYKRIFATGSNIYGNCTNYAIEFDAKIHYTYDSNNNTHDNQLILYGEGASMPASNATFLDSETNYLFKLTGGRQQGVTYTVAADGAAYTYTDAAWYHYSVTVDKESRSVNYTITSGNNQIVGTGTYVLDANVSPNIQGVFVSLGRYNSYIGIDNIHIYTLGYAFTEPGTLTVTSSYPGCADAETTYECDYIGAEIGASGWSTLGCKYPLDLSGSDLPTAYIVSEQTGSSAKLTTVTSAPEYTGLLLEGAEGIYTLPIGGSATLPATNLLTAVTDVEGHTATANNYVLATKTGVTGFYLCKEGITIPAGKAYLPLNDSSRELIMIDETTGISDAIRQMNSEEVNSVMYNLNGQRLLAAPRKGIYIKSGRKNVVK